MNIKEIKFIDIKEIDIDAAYDVALKELKTVKILNDIPDYTENLYGRIWWMQKNTFGKCMLYQNKLIAYMGFVGPWDDLFGECDGILSPLGFNAVLDDEELDGNLVMSLLIQECMRDNYEKGIVSYAIVRLSNLNSNKALIYNSFGIRNEEAVLSLKDYKFDEANKDITIRKIDDINEIEPYFNELCDHLDQSPCFCSSPEGCFKMWQEKDNLSVIGAYKDNKLVSYIALTTEGESYAGESDKRMNICGAYTIDEYRGYGYSKQILDYIARKLINDGYVHFGTDYETINPNALHFWTKYFTVYSDTYHRRLDETIYHRKNKK